MKFWNRHTLPVALIAATTLGAAGCVDETYSAPSASASPVGKADIAGASVVYGLADDGSEVSARFGQSLLIRLPGSPTSGAWAQVEGDRSIGAPNTYFEAAALESAEGYFVFEWANLSPMEQGVHALTFQYAVRGSVTRAYAITVDVSGGVPATLALYSTDEGGTFGVVEGHAVTVTLPYDPERETWACIADRTLGKYASSTVEETPDDFDPAAVTFRWDTDSFLPLSAHTIQCSLYPSGSTKESRRYSVTLAFEAR